MSLVPRLAGGLFLCAAVACSGFVFLDVPDAAARPSGGPSFGEAKSSGTARPSSPSRPISRRSTGRDASSRSAAPEVEPWSSRPRFSSPWSAPAPETYRPGGRGTSPSVGASGSFLSYFFWILVGAAVLVIVPWVYSLTGRKEQEAWQTRRVP